MESNYLTNPRRKILSQTVAVLAQEVGFHDAEKAALETLTEMLQSLLTELGRTTRVFTELGSRVEPTVGDVTMALTDMGLRIDPSSLRNFARRHSRQILPNPGALPIPRTPTILTVGDKRPLPPYIPDYFPPMPDPHAYVRTPTHRQPLTDYAACREKTSQQKRDVERSLTKFFARTSQCFHLFPESSQQFPLILPKRVTYLDPLIPRDQIFEEEVNEAPLNFVKKEKPVEGPRLNDDLIEENNDGKNDTAKKEKESTTSWELIDSPFLRPPKVLKKKKSA